MSDPASKGRALESSVRAIESVILHASPALAEKRFRISSNRVFTVEGVRHEIDVYVEVDIAPGYASVFLFECKNWESKVGKNEVIVFSEKVDALRAQRGFFVAKDFTADAIAQAKKDARMEILVAADQATVPRPLDFFFVEPQVKSTAVTFAQGAGDNFAARVAIDVDAVVGANGDFTVRSYAASWAADVVNEDARSFKAHEMPDGEYPREVVATRDFGSSPISVNGLLCMSAIIKVTYSMRVVRPTVVTDFEVKSRGRAIEFAPVRIGPAEVQVSLVALSVEGG